MKGADLELLLRAIEEMPPDDERLAAVREALEEWYFQATGNTLAWETTITK